MSTENIATRVTTSFGALRGIGDRGVSSFRGIPFAAPPTGARRWRAPEPAEPWRGERDASAFGPSAPQASAGELGELIGIAGGPTSEDCLYLNVWTPAPDARRRPVMVWIHGGGNTLGSGIQPRFNGARLARRGDVVVVTCNYRLGALGFLHAPELGASGNEGLLDQIAALRWVRAEIEAFGGDPGNVTVFGQSAGGFDIAQLMGMPAAESCFERMVPMSGSLRAPVPAADAHAVAARFAKQFGGFATLRTTEAEALVAYQQELTGGHVAGDVRFGPVADGTYIDDPEGSIATGRVTRGPLMIGHCRDEWALWTALSERMQTLDTAGLQKLAARLFAERAPGAIDVYRQAADHAGRLSAPVNLWTAMMTDAMFRIPAIRTAELHGRQTADIWFYRFDQPSPALDGRLGACHSIDIPFVFGNLDAENMPHFCGSGPDVAGLSETMMDCYLAFAHHGNPTHGPSFTWPRYETHERATLVLDAHDCSVQKLGADPVRELWADMGVLD